MSIERRTQLLEALETAAPHLRRIVKPKARIMDGNWDLAAFAYQQAFEAMWDHAIARTAGADARHSSSLIVHPLLMLWRQSVELSIKAATEATTGQQPDGVHDLAKLFTRLLEARQERNDLERDDDDLTTQVARLIAEFQALDVAADRWRYPTDRKGRPYRGDAVDLDQLFQAHAMITGWCDAAGVEVDQANWDRG